MHLCSRKSIPLGNIFKDGMQEVFNSDNMNAVREKMLNGKEVVGCEKCYHLENIGSNSLRLYTNWYFKRLFVDGVVEEWSDDLYGVGNRDYSIDWINIFKDIIESGPSIQWLGIHASNVCNLACRGCYSMLSSKWKKDEKKLGINPYPLYDKELDKFNIDFKKLKFITMFGGEPLIMKQNQQLLDSIEKEGITDNLILQYFTNGTVMPDSDILTIWKKLRKLQLIVSVDAYGKENDYFRYGSDWKNVSTNIKKFYTYSKEYDWDMSTNTLINIYNVNRLEKLHKWLLGVGLEESKIVYNLCIYPQELDIRNLPKEYKKLVSENISKSELPLDLKKLIKEQLKMEPNISFIAAKGFSNKLDEMRNQENPISELKVFMND